jgi:hypothetical protein
VPHRRCLVAPSQAGPPETQAPRCPLRRGLRRPRGPRARLRRRGLRQRLSPARAWSPRPPAAAPSVRTAPTWTQGPSVRTDHVLSLCSVFCNAGDAGSTTELRPRHFPPFSSADRSLSVFAPSAPRPHFPVLVTPACPARVPSLDLPSPTPPHCLSPGLSPRPPSFCSPSSPPAPLTSSVAICLAFEPGCNQKSL